MIDPVTEKSVWAWQLGNEVFGDSVPNQDPDNNGTAFVFDLRFPGQRYDAASGLYQNGQRDYDAATGRYPQSDPIGLNGGVSTYGYALQTPLNAVDPTGLAAYLRDLLPAGQRPQGTIYCVDGVIKPYYNWDAWPSYYEKCSEIRDCVAAHEMSHAADANSSNPGLCRKSPLHFIFGTAPKMVTFPNEPDGKYQYGELDRSELRAHAAELRCLAAKLRAACSNGQCQKIIIERIEQIINQNIPDIKNDTYRSGQ